MSSAMVDRLRSVLNRPLSEADRPRLFAVAVALIFAAAGVLAVLDDGTPSARRAPPAHRSSQSRPTVAPDASVLTTAATPTLPSEEGAVAADALASPAEVRRA